MKRIVYICIFTLPFMSFGTENNKSLKSFFSHYISHENREKFAPLGVIAATTLTSLCMRGSTTPETIILNLFGGLAAAAYKEDLELSKAKQSSKNPDLHKIRISQATLIGVSLLMGVTVSQIK